MIKLSLIPNASQWYKMYTVWGAALIAAVNVAQANSYAIAALIPSDKLPYWNVGLALAVALVRQIHQPVIQPAATPAPASTQRMVVHKEKS